MNSLFNRKYIIQGFIILIALILLGKLFYIQIFSDKYFVSANSNVLRKIYMYPARGVIMDRNNQVLVQNEPVYDLMVTPIEVKNIDTIALANLLGIDKKEFDRLMYRARAKSISRATPFLKQVSVTTYAALMEKLFLFPGFMVQPRSIRVYPDSVGAHLLGYVREVDTTDIRKSEGFYRPGDEIGRTGVERSYEEMLRGQRGVRNMLYDAKNNPQGSYQDGAFDTAAVNGEPLISSIDIRLQKLGEQLLSNKVGSIVAIEPATGEVLAFVSSPGYNPNKMVGRNMGNYYMELLGNGHSPHNIRPIQGTYSPGSAFKPVDALIGLQNGVIDPNTTFFCPSYYRAGNHIVKCEHRDGNVALSMAMARSCNTYFCYIFEKLITKDGMKNQKEAYEKWQKQVRKFGIGDTLGIDVPFERSGKLFTKADYDKKLNNRWGYTSIISLAIGQGEMNTTPLQMANIMAIIANRGYYIKPHLVKAVGENKLIRQKYTEKHYVGIETRHFESVIDGMDDAVNKSWGTAIQSKIPGITMVGKTGTVQNSRGKNHSVFIGFAPRVNPKIAIAVIVENGGYGGTYAAPMASFITEKYLRDSISPFRIPHMEKIKAQNLMPELRVKIPAKPKPVDTTKVIAPIPGTAVIDPKQISQTTR